MNNTSQVPIVLFAYSRPDHIRQTLDSLKENKVPIIYAFSDGPKSSKEAARINEVRKILRSIDWCEIRLTERDTNLGLGRSILTGVTEVLRKHDMLIVFEDDLICVPGTYSYLCAAMEHYRDDPKVMSVTGWTHPLVTPHDVTDQPYFSGRAECWVWGTWARAWQGMETDAKTLMKRCKAEGIDIYKYGADLVGMANREQRQNIWAVRFLYHHILQGGLCLRPPWSMVEHIGAGPEATNVSGNDNGQWSNPPLKSCPPIPADWPKPIENSQCSSLWQRAYGNKPTVIRSLYLHCRKQAATMARLFGIRS